MSKIKSISLILGVLMMSFLVGYFIFAFSEPFQTPPGCTPGQPGCDAPLNVSTNPQTKPGTLSFQTFYDSDNTSWWVDPAGGAGGYAALFNGKVGIGKTNPEKRLTVYGGAGEFTNATGGEVKIINSGNCCSALTLQSTAGNGKTYSIVSGGPDFALGKGEGDFIIYDNTDQKIRFDIDSGGNVGIGTTSPTQKLEVTSVIRLTPTDSPGTCDGTKKGSLYYDNSLSELCDCNGSSWQQVDGGGGC